MAGFAAAHPAMLEAKEVDAGKREQQVLGQGSRAVLTKATIASRASSSSGTARVRPRLPYRLHPRPRQPLKRSNTRFYRVS